VAGQNGLSPRRDKSESAVAGTELDLGALAALFRGKPNLNSRRYTLDMIDGKVVFRLSGFDAVFESTLTETFGERPDADYYNTVIVTDEGPKRLYDRAGDRTRVMGDKREFFGRS
jgi:hypothetical protein